MVVQRIGSKVEALLPRVGWSRMQCLSQSMVRSFRYSPTLYSITPQPVLAHAQRHKCNRQWMSVSSTSSFAASSSTSASASTLQHRHPYPPNSRPSTQQLRKDVSINQVLMKLGSKKQWVELLNYAYQNRREMDFVNMSTLMSQLGRIRTLDKSHPLFLGFVHQLANLLHQHGSDWMEARGAANIVHAIGRMQLRNQDTKRILQWVSEPTNVTIFLTNATTQNVATTAWAMATLNYHCPSFFHTMDLQYSKTLVLEGSAQDVAITLWSFAKMAIPANQLVFYIEQNAQALVNKKDAHAISNIAWSCATLNLPCPHFFAAIQTAADQIVSAHDPQAISNVAWAFATMGVPSTELFTIIDQRSNHLLDEQVPQHISNTVWAFAKLGIPSPKLLHGIDQNPHWLFDKASSRDISNISWAFATQGTSSTNFFALIEQHAEWFVKDLDPQSISNTSWACATLSYDAPQLFAAMEHQCKNWVEPSNVHAVANTAWALASLGYQAPQLFAEIEYNIERLVQQGNAKDISNIAWAYAFLGIDSVRFVFYTSQHLDQFLQSATLPDVTNLCYVIAVSGIRTDQEVVFRKLWHRAMELFVPLQDSSEEYAHMLSQIQLFATADGIADLETPNPVVARLAVPMYEICAVDDSVSIASQTISSLLQTIGFVHDTEVIPHKSIANGFLAIDFACTTQKVAIEYDGPSHYLKAVGSGQLTRTENGRTKAKRRFLQKLGWTVVNLNFHDHINACNENKEKEWLEQKLQSAGVILKESADKLN